MSRIADGCVRKSNGGFVIKYVKGDMLESTAEALAHGVAPNDDFKQGLALSLRERWPDLYKDFRHYCKTNHPKEGGIWSWKGVKGPKVINLLTQQHPSVQGGIPGKAHTSYVSSTLKELAKVIEAEGIKSVALTRLATGVGGLSWSEVKPLIEMHLKGSKATIFVYEEYQKGQKAAEV
jgi:O-acetyl-ADP-ribose deacetylase (regulator of RNase III)